MNIRINRGILVAALILSSVILFTPSVTARQTVISTDVLVAGGTASGVPAAIQAARDGVRVVIVEPTPWLGGMLTTAGVSATDGNHRLPSGIWGEFRKHIYDYYGGPEAVATGWVSNTQFEPSVGNSILTGMVSDEELITTIHGYHVVSCLLSGSRVMGAVFTDDTSVDTLIVKATISVDATETGDLMALAGCRYFIGQDSRNDTGEMGAPQEATDIVQDLTYVAVLKDYSDGSDHTISKPQGYDPSLYDCTGNCACNDSSLMRYTCESVLSYGRLPNGKYMINWPYRGNDYYLNDLELDYKTRKEQWQKAKNHTLGWVYFMQTVAGFSNLGLADDEYPTADLLPFYPYYRESRRLDGVIQLRNYDLADPYRDTARSYYKTAISVGDYPLDLHHNKMPREIFYSTEPVPSFSVPFGCLVPESIDGLIVAEKSISVSHIANGCTRLQPAVMLTGQAAGAAAAQCVVKGTEPRRINIRALQQHLLNSGCWLLPFVDISPSDPGFGSAQRVSLCGIMRGAGITEGWANRTFFYPEGIITPEEMRSIKAVINKKQSTPFLPLQDTGSDNALTRKEVIMSLWKLYCRNSRFRPGAKNDAVELLNQQLPGQYILTPERLNAPATRIETACWIDILFNPFSENIPIN